MKREQAMKLVDAHIHLSDPKYGDKIATVINDSRSANVVAVVSNSMNLETSKISLRLTEEYPDFVYAAVGIHPWNVNQLSETELEQTIEFIVHGGANKGEVVAIGEIGLDPQYAKRKAQRELQTKVFHEMLRLGEKLRLPLIVHSRWSAPTILEMLSSYHLSGVLWHWFSSPTEVLPRIIERGDFVSEGPPAVFSDRIQDVVRLVPLENLLTETDGPVQYYGAFKDRATTPALVADVVKAIARTKAVDENMVAEKVAENFSRLFGVRL
jgi:TatD DNase family protein